MGELVVTNKGKELITKLIEGSETINFTRIKTSVHDYSSDNLEDLTDIEEVKQESMISSVEKTDNTTVEVIAMINNSTLQEGYYIKTIGLYAQDSNSNEILYGVSIAGKYPDYMPAYGGKTVSSISYKLITKVDNSEQVNIEINPAAIPTITQINELKQVVIETKELFNKHISEEIASEEGSHGFKYDEDESKLKYKKNGIWEDIPTGQQAETEINEHKEKSILNAEGVHDFKYDESSQRFKYKKDGTWNDINTSGNTQGLEEHKGKSILNAEGVHDLKYDESSQKLKYKKDSVWEDIAIGQQAETEINNHKTQSVISSEGMHGFKYNKSQNELQYKENDDWNNIDITAKHRGVRVIGGDGVHGIKFDTSDKRLKYKNNSNNWENIPTGQEEVEKHVKTKVASEEGMHGLRYHDNKLQHYNESSRNWENVKQDVLVTGLTASVLKVGTTAVIETEGEELKRVTGTFTSDATATANHIAPGRTAYVNGNKLTGTFTNDANATASDIVSGKSAYVNGQKILGNLTKSDKPIAAIFCTTNTYNNVGNYTNLHTKVMITPIDNSWFTANYMYRVYGDPIQHIYFKKSAKIRIYGSENYTPPFNDNRYNNGFSFPWGYHISPNTIYSVNSSTRFSAEVNQMTYALDRILLLLCEVV